MSNIRVFILLFSAGFLSACAFFQEFQSTDDSDARYCLENPSGDATSFCDLQYWLSMQRHVATIPWKDRKEHITSLGSSNAEAFESVIWRQAPDTPYQDRLRAQNTLRQLIPMMSPALADWSRTNVLLPNQRILELESALVVAKQNNDALRVQIEEQLATIKAQDKKLRTLLDVETQMLENKQ